MTWANGVKDIVFVEDGSLGNTPAAVHRASGIIYFNRDVWNKLNPDQRFFLLLHEAAHVWLKSSDEKLVDALAHKLYLEKGKSLKNSFLAITRNLTFNNPEHFKRVKNQFKRAWEFDRIVNKNPKTPKIF
jgi:hypothetical protein